MIRFRHRVARNRALYFIVWGILLGAFAYVTTQFTLRFQELFVLALAAILPGRIVSFFWKDFFRGKRLMKYGDWAGASRCFERFLEKIEKSPSLKWLMFFSYGLYSFKVEAVALTYDARCRLHLKDYETAAQKLERALTIDTQYTAAYRTSAALAILRGSSSQAESFYEKAVQCGEPRAVPFEEFRRQIEAEYNA
jgi:tetratricopeptide (TPR) repeat protein